MALLLESGGYFLLEIAGSALLLEDGAPRRQETGGGRSKKKRGKRTVVIDDKTYIVPERDIPALLEAKLKGRKAPSTATVETPDVEEEGEYLQSDTLGIVWPSVDEAKQRYEQLLAQLNAQYAYDLADSLKKVADRVMAELEDEEEAVTLLLLH